MDMLTFLPYLLVMAGVTYLIRALPFVLVNKKIENRFLNSFLYYIPYTVLAAMTFPAILYGTNHMISAIAGLASPYSSPTKARDCSSLQWAPAAPYSLRSWC